MESQLSVDVVSVFTDAEGGHGNPLGLLRSSAETRGREQEIATALGFSETVFVEEIEEGPAPHGRSARIRIFTPAAELPFAGHPCVGTAWWLARAGLPVCALRVTAGDVAVRYDGELTWITGRASWAPEFTWHPLATPAEVDALDPADFGEGKHYFWAWVDEGSGHLRSRMFAPAMGIAEDEATGAAAVRITAQLGRDLAIDQGAGSRILTRRLGGDDIAVGGRTVEAPSVTVDLTPTH
ncbi:PhzF family phenazine biosynthesis protein [Herbiconiux sp. CPCC 205763]|uniref:PhzF family phenazine biosynthesis protein n=1 Tax=Herbiconiux aconitum TaxID=2970913 RepID=A0ABT2GSM4_9MICO|nr:PhzF family phenazine biosynthesis protein [Herbiconiux aconitum]MCS5719183.1 PhzF family phenazine biosynthesis protein [Herbiconiux aconitum]